MIAPLRMEHSSQILTLSDVIRSDVFGESRVWQLMTESENGFTDEKTGQFFHFDRTYMELLIVMACLESVIHPDLISDLARDNYSQHTCKLRQYLRFAVKQKVMRSKGYAYSACDDLMLNIWYYSSFKYLRDLMYHNPPVEWATDIFLCEILPGKNYMTLDKWWCEMFDKGESLTGFMRAISEEISNSFVRAYLLTMIEIIPFIKMQYRQDVVRNGRLGLSNWWSSDLKQLHVQFDKTKDNINRIKWLVHNARYYDGNLYIVCDKCLQGVCVGDVNSFSGDIVEMNVSDHEGCDIFNSNNFNWNQIFEERLGFSSKCEICHEFRDPCGLVATES